MDVGSIKRFTPTLSPKRKSRHISSSLYYSIEKISPISTIKRFINDLRLIQNKSQKHEVENCFQILLYLIKKSTYEFFHVALLKYERKFNGYSGNSEWIHNLRNYSFQLQGFCNVKGVVTFDPWVDVIASGLKALIGSQGDSKYRVNETFLRSLTVSAPLRTNCQSQCPLSHVPNICPSTKKIFVKSDFFKIHFRNVHTIHCLSNRKNSYLRNGEQKKE